MAQAAQDAQPAERPARGRPRGTKSNNGRKVRPMQEMLSPAEKRAVTRRLQQHTPDTAQRDPEPSRKPANHAQQDGAVLHDVIDAYHHAAHRAVDYIYGTWRQAAVQAGDHSRSGLWRPFGA